MKRIFTWFNANIDVSVPARSFPERPARRRVPVVASTARDVADAIAYAMSTGRSFEIPCTSRLSEWLERNVRGREWIGGQAAIIANHLSRWVKAYIGSPYIGQSLASLFKRKSRVFVDYNGIQNINDANGKVKRNYIFRFAPGDSFHGTAAGESARVIVSTEPGSFPPVFEGFSMLDADAAFFSGLHHFSGRDWKRFDGFVERFGGWKHLELTTMHGNKLKAARRRLDMFDSIGLDDEEMEALFSSSTPREQAEAMLNSGAREMYMHGEGYYMCMVERDPRKVKRAMERAGVEAVRYSGGRPGRMDSRGIAAVREVGSISRHGRKWIVTVPYPVAERPVHMAGMGDVISSTIVMFGRLV